MNIFLAPHNDDEALFGSFIIQRTHPMVVIVTDGVQHQKKFGIKVETRRDESMLGCLALGVDVDRIHYMGLSDETVTQEEIEEGFRVLEKKYRAVTGLVFAPTCIGGNLQHDMVSIAAKNVWKDRVLYYGTYTRENFSPAGEMAIIGDVSERNIKDRALACYPSQIGINGQHFNAVKNVPEYLSFKP